jgi:hypothetical protein
MLPIRDEADLRAHMDYVHFNSVKHGLVDRVRDWRSSTFHDLVKQGVYSLDWAGDPAAESFNYPDRHAAHAPRRKSPWGTPRLLRPTLAASGLRWLNA